jgi:hypothetical protein
LKLEYTATFTLENRYLIAIVLHDKQDHSNALVTSDYLSETEFKTFNHATLTYIDPARVPKEILTNSIITKVFNSDQVDFENYILVGVVRSNESPNTEKDTIFIKD